MTVLSLLRGFKPCTAVQRMSVLSQKNSQTVPMRQLYLSVARCSKETLPIKGTRWQWETYKDLLHFYIMLGVIPLAIGVTLINIFIGPATLTEIPEGYVPKHWEYHRHPITRFLTRYYFFQPEMVYERNLHYLKELCEVSDMSLLQSRANMLMGERGDYPGVYQNKLMNSKYLRHLMADDDYARERTGQSDY